MALFDAQVTMPLQTLLPFFCCHSLQHWDWGYSWGKKKKKKDKKKVRISSLALLFSGISFPVPLTRNWVFVLDLLLYAPAVLFREVGLPSVQLSQEREEEQ